MKPRVSIVVPCRNERDQVEPFLAAALGQQGVEGDFEVIVADGVSTDGTREWLAAQALQHARLRVIDNPRRTVSPGLNEAIRVARGDVIVRMDVHSRFAEDYVAQCLRALETSHADCVGGPALTCATGRFQRANALAYHSRLSVGGARFHDPHYEGYVDTVTYGCWRRATLLRLGLFDEALVRNQDDELSLRLIRSGGQIWQTPRIRSWYLPRASLRGLFRQYYQYGYWKVAVIRKHRLPASPRHLVPVATLVLALVLAIGGTAMPELWSALGVLTALYAALVLGTSVVVAWRARAWAELLQLPAVFVTYHWSYALGFAHALARQMVGLAEPAHRAVELSR